MYFQGDEPAIWQLSLRSLALGRAALHLQCERLNTCLRPIRCKLLGTSRLFTYISMLCLGPDRAILGAELPVIPAYSRSCS